MERAGIRDVMMIDQIMRDAKTVEQIENEIKGREEEVERAANEYKSIKERYREEHIARGKIDRTIAGLRKLCNELR
jgi:tRNA-dihydrouridine synthase